jgi:hypothetical protein
MYPFEFVAFLSASACLDRGIAVSRGSRQVLVNEGTKWALLGRGLFKKLWMMRKANGEGSIC